ncbi:hypothetical protein VP01_3460g1, partial [Puccinia sorghi]
GFPQLGDYLQPPHLCTFMDVENSPLDKVFNVFQGQWLMWRNAHNTQNAQMMSISSQDLIIKMGGQREMIRICNNWDAREELRRLDYLPHPSTNQPCSGPEPPTGIPPKRAHEYPLGNNQLSSREHALPDGRSYRLPGPGIRQPSGRDGTSTTCSPAFKSRSAAAVPTPTATAAAASAATPAAGKSVYWMPAADHTSYGRKTHPPSSISTHTPIHKGLTCQSTPLLAGLLPREVPRQPASTLLDWPEELQAPKESYFHCDGNKGLLHESREESRKTPKTPWLCQRQRPNESKLPLSTTSSSNPEYFLNNASI